MLRYPLNAKYVLRRILLEAVQEFQEFLDLRGITGCQEEMDCKEKKEATE